MDVRSEFYLGPKAEKLFTTYCISATIPIDVVRRSTVHAGDDFILVGASDNGESAPMLRWDSGNSEWIQLEVKKVWGK